MVNRSAAFRRITATSRVVAGITLAATTAAGAAGDGFTSFLSAPAFEERRAYQPPTQQPVPAARAPVPAPGPMPQSEPQTASPFVQTTPEQIAPKRAPIARSTTFAPAFDSPVTPLPAAPVIAAPRIAAPETADSAPLASAPVEAVDPLAPPRFDRGMAANIARISALLDSGVDVPEAEIRAVAGLAPRTTTSAGFRQQDILPPAQPAVFNLRLALAMLSQGRQRLDDERVRLAQGTRGDTALSLSGGIVTLDVLRDSLTRTGMQADSSGPLRVPVVLLEDTVLRLSPGDLLEMSRSDGAFIMSFGRVEINGATLRSVGDQNTVIGSYRPFLVISGTGSMTMQNARIEGLGFGDTTKYSGVSVLGHPLRPMDGVTEILDSVMTDVLSVSLTAVNAARVVGNRFSDVRGSAVRISAGPRSIVSDNIFFGGGPTNAIRILDRSDDSVLTGNILLAGERAGIVVRRSHGPVIEDNVIWGRDGGAVKFQETECGVIAGNMLIDSKQKGVEIRASEATVIRGNLISGNRSAGIWISAQDDDALTQVTANRLQGNGSGLVGATAASVSLESNDLTAQLPRLADGDLTEASGVLARDLKGTEPMLLTGAGAAQAAPITCGKDEV